MAKIVAVLLVEDNDVDVLALRRAFRRIAVVNPLYIAHDGIEALSALRGEYAPPIPQPRLILLDLNMPRMNGLEFLAELRADENLCDSPVFVLTTSDDDKDIAAAFSHDILGYLSKSRLADEMRRVARYIDQVQKAEQAVDEPLPLL